MLKKKMILSLFAAVSLSLGACGNSDGDQGEKKEDSEHMDHGSMNHSSSGEVPEGLKEALKPAYEVGSKAIIKTDHMEGMNGAEATISGAYDTTVYSISYTPEGGGEPVENHKWIIHEEIKDAPEEPFKAGDEVTVEASHMEGMEGAEAVIDSAEKTTVYMVDYTPEGGGEKVKNHKWVTESELEKAE
ncbi:YdhK family protein [Metabacillus idriensis]|uniref:YdhK family protein n=1 Tax=Metabacillus idriensis TaxID=324768 RepID=UPI00203C32C0|nr:YdhK family protein [Metabacillus idriensis]MCM3598473.1 YdhK family protein [Metabacillus idriensis]